jgi:hypothetical protein
VQSPQRRGKGGEGEGGGVYLTGSEGVIAFSRSPPAGPRMRRAGPASAVPLLLPGAGPQGWAVQACLHVEVSELVSMPRLMHG